MLSFRDSLPNLRSNIRLIHAAAGAPSVDIYANGNLVAKNLSFSDISNYTEIAPGDCKVEIFKTGTYDTPVSYEEFEILPNTTITVSIVLEESDLVTLKVTDGLDKSTPSLSNLRFINLSPDSPLFTLSLSNETVLFSGVEYLETTNYYPLSPGIYDFLLTNTNDSSYRKFLNNIDLQPSFPYTIYIIGLVNGTPELGYLWVKDEKRVGSK